MRSRTIATISDYTIEAETWGGTVYFAAGQSVATIRPPRQRGIGVVASVVSGPAGTRVASVTIDAQGEALIALSEPARAPVNVARFAVPGVADQSPEVPPGMT